MVEKRNLARIFAVFFLPARRRGRIIKSICAGLLLIIASGSMTPGLAQTEAGAAASPPDKSSYTLFNPTPDDQMRPFCTDRPTKSNLPCTVDAGHFQYEADIINWTYAHTDGVTANEYLIPNPTFKLGLTNTIDLELNIAPVEKVSASGPLGKQSLTGISNLILRTKVNLAGPEGGDFQAAIIPYVQLPTAKPGIGNKAVEGGAIAPISFALPQDFTLLFDPEVDILRNAENYGRHANFQNLANLSHALSASVTGYIELWGQVNNDPAGTTKQASLDLALSWLVWPDLPNLQFDIGTNIGLTAVTPKIQAYIGVSQRF
jgi:Putative MetA-pathway of phenol degradation